MEEGDEPLKPIWDVLIELVIVVIVGAVLLAIVFKASQNDIFEKRFLSKDMALLLDTLYASRGNSVFVYGNSLNFSFDLEMRLTVSRLRLLSLTFSKIICRFRIRTSIKLPYFIGILLVM